MTLHVHDNFVYAIVVQLEQRLLVLHTEYCDGPGPNELTDVRFSGVIGHHFDDVSAPSILLDIEEIGVQPIVQQWSELFERAKNYGWLPFQYANLTELLQRLADEGVNGYRVFGTCGLDGFVLAKAIEFQRRELAAQFPI